MRSTQLPLGRAPRAQVANTASLSDLCVWGTLLMLFGLFADSYALLIAGVIFGTLGMLFLWFEMNAAIDAWLRNPKR